MVFWDSVGHEQRSKNVTALRHIAAAGDHCVLVSGPDPAVRLLICRRSREPEAWRKARGDGPVTRRRRMRTRRKRNE